MISDLHQLSEKVRQLAQLADSLRSENAELRQSVAELTTENTDLSRRIEEAYQRVSALIDKLPVTGEQNEEAA